MSPTINAAAAALTATAAVPAWNWTSIVSFVAGAGVAVFAEPIRKLIFRPALEVAFDATTCILQTPTLLSSISVHPATCETVKYVAESEGRWLRVRVGSAKRLTRRLVKGCRPYLIAVEIDEHGKFVPSIFADTLQLKWSSQPADGVGKAIDIPGDVTQFVDVLAADKDKPSNYSLQSVIPTPFYFRTLFDEKPKRLRLTILITSDEAPSMRIRIVFEWKGAWNTFDAYQD